MSAASSRRGRGAPQPGISDDELLERIRTEVYDSVSEAAARIAHLETGWSQSELVKRVTGYIYKAVKPVEQRSLPWKEAARSLINHAFGSYGSACAEKAWFFEIDITDAFLSAVWQLIQAGSRDRVRITDVEDFVRQECETHLDGILRNKAIWDAAQGTFGDTAVVNKVFTALSKSWHSSLEACIADKKPKGDLERVEDFVRRWLEASMSRAWTSVDGSERHITEGNVLRLFSKLMHPFGDDNSYTCVPQILTDQIGPPPPKWKFLRVAVVQLFRSWKQDSLQSAPKRRRKSVPTEAFSPPAEQEHVHSGNAASRGRAAVGQTRSPEPVLLIKKDESEEEVEGEAVAEELGELGEELDADLDLGGLSGHGLCTSAEDCVGSPNDSLVQHLFEDSAGDVYCECCWRNFLLKNPDLEGIWQDGPLEGQPFAE